MDRKGLHLALLVCAVFGLANSQEGCFAATKCMGPDFNKALSSNNLNALCNLLPTTISCIQEALKNCEGSMATVLQNQLAGLEKRKETCASTGPNCSSKELEACYTTDLQQAAEEGNKEMLCQLVPDVLSCVDRYMESCGDQMTKKMKAFVTTLKENAVCASSVRGPDDSAHTLSALASPLLVLLGAIAFLLAKM